MASGQSLLVGTVGEITNAQRARDLVQDTNSDRSADVLFIGRQFLRDAGWVLRAAEELGVEVVWPTQIARPQIQQTRIFSKM